MKTTRRPVAINRLSASARCFARSIVFSLGFAVVGLSSAAAAKPLKVFILAGRSNMQGHAKVSTFEHFGKEQVALAINEAGLGSRLGTLKHGGQRRQRAAGGGELAAWD